MGNTENTENVIWNVQLFGEFKVERCDREKITISNGFDAEILSLLICQHTMLSASVENNYIKNEITPNWANSIMRLRKELNYGNDGKNAISGRNRKSIDKALFYVDAIEFSKLMVDKNLKGAFKLRKKGAFWPKKENFSWADKFNERLISQTTELLELLVENGMKNEAEELLCLPTTEFDASKVTGLRDKIKKIGKGVTQSFLSAPETNRSAIPPKTILIGRESLLESSREKLKSHNALVLYGEGGMGKTAIAKHLAHEFKDDGFRVVWIDCEEFKDLDAIISIINNLVYDEFREIGLGEGIQEYF